MKTRRPITLLALAAVLVATVLTGCAKDDGAETRGCGGGGSGSGAGGASSAAANTGGRPFAVTTDEWSIKAPATAEAGKNLIEVNNDGERTHEVLVIKNVAPADLPTGDDGTLDETGLPDGAVLGEVEGVEPGADCDGSFELDPGEYTLVCNLVDEEDDGTQTSHLAKGMIAEVKVP